MTVHDDWDAEYGEGGPAHEWFEQYLGTVEQAAAEMFLEALAFFEDDALPIPGRSPIAGLLDRVRSTQVVPPPALRGTSSSVPPDKVHAEEDIGLRPTVFALMDSIAARMSGPTEEERVTRELVPLVRAAVTEAASPGRWLA